MQRPLPRRVIEQIAVFIIGSVFAYSASALQSLLFLSGDWLKCDATPDRRERLARKGLSV